MPRPKNPLPTIRKHSSGQARVTIDGKDYLLGTYNSPESFVNYAQLITEHAHSIGRFAPEGDQLTIADLLARYWLHAEKYYSFDQNPHRGDCYHLKRVLKITDSNFGQLSINHFKPSILRRLQELFVAQGWCRKECNRAISITKRIFKWGVAEELVDSTILHALQAVPELRRGRTTAPDHERVKPVSDQDIDATKPFLRPGIRAMVEFMRLTGCRPNEVCQLRLIDIDRTNSDCWIFRPQKHKTQHHDHSREIMIGPRGQAVITPFIIETEPSEYLFSPIREEKFRNQERRRHRRTKLTPSQRRRRRNAQRRKRKRPFRERYDVNSLRRAINRACKAAKITPWGPNRIRHTFATSIRSHGLDQVATILGHSKLETTQIYSEKNQEAAMKIIVALC